MMRKINLLVFAGVLLLAGAVGLTAYNLYSEAHAGTVSDAAITEIIAAVPETRPALTEEEVLALPPEEIEEYPDYIVDPYKDLPLITIGDYQYCGTVSIPTISIELPVINECTDAALKTAPCRYEGSAYLNNMVICGHNYKTHLGHIRNLAVGDPVTFTDNKGNVFSYHVTGIETLGAYDSDIMTEGNYGLTLFTCTLGGKTRVTVRCERDK